MGIGIPISQSKRPLPILFSSWLADINVRRELRFHRGDASVPARATRSHRPMRVGTWSRTIARATRWWAGRAGVPPLEVSWHKLTGPLFGNTVATLDLDGEHAQVTFLQPRSAGSMTEVAELVLVDGRRAGTTRRGRAGSDADVTHLSSIGRPRAE